MGGTGTLNPKLFFFSFFSFFNLYPPSSQFTGEDTDSESVGFGGWGEPEATTIDQSYCRVGEGLVGADSSTVQVVVGGGVISGCVDSSFSYIIFVPF